MENQEKITVLLQETDLCIYIHLLCCVAILNLFSKQESILREQKDLAEIICKQHYRLFYWIKSRFPQDCVYLFIF